MQKLITDCEAYRFNDKLQKHLSEGYKVVPGTMVVVLDTSKDRLVGSYYAVVVEEVVKNSRPDYMLPPPNNIRIH